MSVYDSIREGIQEDWRKAQRYDSMKEDFENKLAKAKECPNKDVWTNGFHCGFEAARRLYRGERPKHENEFWDEFLKSVTPKQTE